MDPLEIENKRLRERLVSAHEALEKTMELWTTDLAELSRMREQEITITQTAGAAISHPSPGDATPETEAAASNAGAVGELRDAVEQMCADLNQAHNEVCKMQGIDPERHDWPEWTPQANSIRWAERHLGKRLAKTDAWSEFPSRDTSETLKGGA